MPLPMPQRLSEEAYSAEFRRLRDDPQPSEPPPALPGIVPVRLSNWQFRLELSGPDAASLLTLLEWLPVERELSFWDSFYPKLTDPGAGVSIQSDHGRFVHKLGNHGWTSGWNLQSPEVLAAWIILNLNAPLPHEPLAALHLTRMPIYWLDPARGRL